MSMNIRILEKLQNLKFNPIKQDRMPKNTTIGIGQKSQYSISYISKVQTFFQKPLLDLLLLPTIAMENSIHFFGAFRKGNVTRLTRCGPLTAEIIIKKGCFWYVWIGKDQNFALRTIFSHFNANWQSQRAFSQGGFTEPPLM